MPYDQKEYNKKYYQKNKEKIKQQKKEYYENNKEYHKEYDKTENGKKSRRINNLNCKNCEKCSVELTDGNTSSNRRCMDHSHTTGQFRNIICHGCNVRRGEDNF